MSNANINRIESISSNTNATNKYFLYVNIVVLWFITFNTLAHICLNKIDYLEVKNYKIDAFIDILDVSYGIANPNILNCLTAKNTAEIIGAKADGEGYQTDEDYIYNYQHHQKSLEYQSSIDFYPTNILELIKYSLMISLLSIPPLNTMSKIISKAISTRTPTLEAFEAVIVMNIGCDIRTKGSINTITNNINIDLWWYATTTSIPTLYIEPTLKYGLDPTQRATQPSESYTQRHWKVINNANIDCEFRHVKHCRQIYVHMISKALQSKSQSITIQKLHPCF